MATHLVKIKLDGDLRIMEIASPPRFDGLVKAVMEAYAVRSGRERELTFTYRDNDGDEVRSETRLIVKPRRPASRDNCLIGSC